MHLRPKRPLLHNFLVFSSFLNHILTLSVYLAGGFFSGNAAGLKTKYMQGPVVYAWQKGPVCNCLRIIPNKSIIYMDGKNSIVFPPI